MFYNNKSSEERKLFYKLFDKSIGVASEPEQEIILEKLLNICKPHILGEFPDRLILKRYAEYEDKPAIYGDNYIIDRLYRCAETKNFDRSSYRESFHITILAIINNIPVRSTFYIVWKDIAYLDASNSNNILELLCISPFWINTKIYKYTSISK